MEHWSHNLMVCRFFSHFSLWENIMEYFARDCLYFICNTSVLCKFCEQLLLSLKPQKQQTVIIIDWRSYSVSNMPTVVVWEWECSVCLQLSLCFVTSQSYEILTETSVLKQNQLAWKNLRVFYLLNSLILHGIKVV